jgi:hypothetical protein
MGECVKCMKSAAALKDISAQYWLATTALAELTEQEMGGGRGGGGGGDSGAQGAHGGDGGVGSGGLGVRSGGWAGLGMTVEEALDMMTR